VDRVEIGNVDTPRVGSRTLRPVLLDVHSKETNVRPVDVLKCEKGFGSAE
jgi:hypothetical protein